MTQRSMALLQDIAPPRTIYERLQRRIHYEPRQDTNPRPESFPSLADTWPAFLVLFDLDPASLPRIGSLKEDTRMIHPSGGPGLPEASL